MLLILLIAAFAVDFSISLRRFPVYTSRRINPGATSQTEAVRLLPSGRPVRYSSTALQTLIDDSIDISPGRDGGIYKSLIRRGNPAKGYPLIKDVVQIAWKIYSSNGSVVHDSKVLEEPFDFTVGAEPRHVIQGWEIAVKTMFEGEVASYIMKPTYAFGEKGLDILNVAPNATLRCELELVEIKPSVLRSYPSVGLNESIKDELVAKIQSGESAITDEVMQNKQINETKSNDERKFFDPEQHKLDPSLRVRGAGKGHNWEETPRAIDVEVPLPVGREFRKRDLTVEIRATSLLVKIDDGETLLEGPLEGKILPSQSMWAILPADPSASTGGSGGGGQRILISMEKAHGSQDIWASVISRSFLEGK